MRLQGVGVGVVGAIAVISTVLALATVWLFLTNPVTVANAVNEGAITTEVAPWSHENEHNGSQVTCAS